MVKIKNFNNRPKSKFNPGKFGSSWASIFWKAKPGLSPVGESNQPIIGSLNISGRQFDLTFSECNKIIETLEKVEVSQFFEKFYEGIVFISYGTTGKKHIEMSIDLMDPKILKHKGS